MPFNLLANNVKYLVGNQESLDTYCHFIIEDAGNKIGNIYPVSKLFTFLQTAQPDKKSATTESQENGETADDKLQEAMKRKQKEARKTNLIAQRAAALIQRPHTESEPVKRNAPAAVQFDDDDGADAFGEDAAVENFKERKLANKFKRQRRGRDAMLEETDPDGALGVKAFRKRDNDWDCEDDLRSDDEEDFTLKPEDEEEAEAVLAAAEKNKPGAEEGEASSDSEEGEGGEEGEEEGTKLAPLGKELRDLCDTLEKKALDAELDDISSDEDDDEDRNMGEDGEEGTDLPNGDEDGNGGEGGILGQGSSKNQGAEPEADGPNVLQRAEEAAMRMAKANEQSDTAILERRVIREFQKAAGRLDTKDLLLRLNITNKDAKQFELFKNILKKVVRSVVDANGNKSLVLKDEYT